MEILFEQIIVEHQEVIHQHLDNTWDIKATIDTTKAIIIYMYSLLMQIKCSIILQNDRLHFDTFVTD
jgi:hypothetical protein